MSRYISRLACRFHPDAEFIEDSRAGDVICSECGLVVGERMVDVSSEWRTFSDGGDGTDRSRVGAADNLLFDNTDLSTTMSTGTGTGAVDEFGRQKYKNGSRQMSAKDEALERAHRTVHQMAARIHLSKRIMDRAFLIYKACYENNCIRGRAEDGIIAACIYIACRKEGESRSIKEICAIATNSSKVEIGRCFKHIIKKLPTLNQAEGVEMNSLIPRFCAHLKLTDRHRIQNTAVHIAERAKAICEVQGRAPDSIAGAAIYMTCAAADEKQSLHSIEVATGAVETTIRTVYKLMLPKASDLFPKNFEFKCPITNLPTF